MTEKYVYEGFFKRVLAFLIDGLILSSFTGIIMKINPHLILVVSVAYFVLLDASKSQGTFGKQCLGLKIVNKDGQKMTYLQALWRHVLKYFGILFLGIGYIGLLFNITHKKALVDYVSKTKVIYNR